MKNYSLLILIVLTFIYSCKKEETLTPMSASNAAIPSTTPTSTQSYISNMEIVFGTQNYENEPYFNYDYHKSKNYKVYFNDVYQAVSNITTINTSGTVGPNSTYIGGTSDWYNRFINVKFKVNDIITIVFDSLKYKDKSYTPNVLIKMGYGDISYSLSDSSANVTNGRFLGVDDRNNKYYVGKGRTIKIKIIDISDKILLSQRIQ